VIVLQRLIQTDAVGKGQNRFIARMRKLRSWFKANPCAPDTEGHIGSMVKLQRFSEFQTCSGVVLTVQGPRKCAAGRSSTHTLHHHPLNPMTLTVDVQPDFVSDGDIGHGGNLDVGIPSFGIHGEPGLCSRLPDFGNRDHFVFFN